MAGYPNFQHVVKDALNGNKMMDMYLWAGLA